MRMRSENQDIKAINKFTNNHKIISRKVAKMQKRELSGKYTIHDGNAMSAYRYYHEMILRYWVIWLTAITVFIVGIFEFLVH